jgi:hypothetical protein
VLLIQLFINTVFDLWIPGCFIFPDLSCLIFSAWH